MKETLSTMDEKAAQSKRDQDRLADIYSKVYMYKGILRKYAIIFLYTTCYMYILVHTPAPAGFAVQGDKNKNKKRPYVSVILFPSIRAPYVHTSYINILLDATLK